jgi:hypothetical protein
VQPAHRQSLRSGLAIVFLGSSEQNSKKKTNEEVWEFSWAFQRAPGGLILASLLDFINFVLAISFYILAKLVI